MPLGWVGAGDNGLIILMEDGCQGGCREQTLGKTLTHTGGEFLSDPGFWLQSVIPPIGAELQYQTQSKFQACKMLFF